MNSNLDLIKEGKQVYFIPSKRYKKYQIGKIISFDKNENVFVKWKNGIKQISKSNINLLHENLLIYFWYLKKVPKNQRNLIRNQSKKFDDLIMEYFYKFNLSNESLDLIKEIENYNFSGKKLNIYLHYLKLNLRRDIFKNLNIEENYYDPVIRAKYLKKLKEFLK